MIRAMGFEQAVRAGFKNSEIMNKNKLALKIKVLRQVHPILALDMAHVVQGWKCEFRRQAAESHDEVEKELQMRQRWP